MSSCGVFGFLFLVGFVLLFLGKTPGFLLSPILQHVGIANQRQNVLMDVRASSVHGMSSKKKMFRRPYKWFVVLPGGFRNRSEISYGQGSNLYKQTRSTT